MTPARIPWGPLQQITRWSLERQLPCLQSTAAALWPFRHPWQSWQAHGRLPEYVQVRGVGQVGYRLPKSERDPYRTPPKNYVQLLQHIRKAPNLDKLNALIDGYVSKFDSIHVAAAMARMPKLVRPILPGEQLPRAVARARTRQPAIMLDQLQDMAVAHPERLFCREVSNIIWALGRCRGFVPPARQEGSKTQTLIKTLLERLQGGPKSKPSSWHLLWAHGNSRDVAQLLYGMARLRFRDPKTLDELSRFARKRSRPGAGGAFSSWEPKEVALMVWGFGKLRWRDDKALGVLLARVEERYLYLRPSTLCALLSGLTRLGYRSLPGGLGGAVAEVAQDQIRSFTPQHLASFTRSLAHMPRLAPPQQLLTALNTQALDQLEGFNAQDLGMMLKGLADLRGLGGELAAAVAAGIAEEDKIKLRPADGFRVLYAFIQCQQLNLDSPQVQRSAELIAQALVKPTLCGAVRPDLIVGVSVALAKIGCLVPSLLDGFGDVVWHTQLSLSSSSSSSGQELQEGQGGGKGGPARGFGPGQLVQMLQSFNRLGHVHERLCSAANTELQQQAEVLAASWDHKQQQLQQPEEAAESAGKQQQEKEQQLLLDDLVDLAQELATAKRLRPEAGGAVAAAAGHRLQQMKPRKVTMLLQALTSKGDLVSEPEVRELFNRAAGWLRGAVEGAQGSGLGLMPLAGLPVALGDAVRHGLLRGSGPELMGLLLERVGPLVGRLNREQVFGLLRAVQEAQLEGGELQQQLREVAAARGWTDGPAALRG